MTTETLTISAFVLARIEEDEAVALESLERGFGGWEWLADHGINFEARTHIARNNPARVLATCKAHRAIVELHAQDGSEPWCREGCGMRAGAPEFPCDTVRALAQPFADHPDFQESWRA